MIESKIPLFVSGVQNKLPADVINQDASADSLSWLTMDGAIELFRGRALYGTEGVLGQLYGLFFAPKANGVLVPFRKTSTKIQYYDGSAWQDVITGLTAEDYTFASYASLAGAYVYIGGPDGLYKIATANPASYKNMYDGTYNHKGKFIINEQRMFLWDRRDGTPDTTGLYLSKIDPQGTNYTTVTNEVLATGDGATTTFTGTLAAASGNRFVFGISINTNPASVTATDNFVGVISGTGITGTINYATGAYSLTFSSPPALATTIRASYQWEDSNNGGITDFRYTSGTRLAGEGDIIPQEYRGEAIQNVIVFDGKYYSFKKTCVYELDLTIDDTNATNIVFRSDIGIPSMRSAVSTGKGIIFMNTANPSKPILTILQKNPLGGNLDTANITPLFAWENYTMTDLVLDTWDEQIIALARTPDSTYNNRIFLINSNQKYSVDIGYYSGRMFAKDSSGNLYVGDSLMESTYIIFNGFDDLDTVVDNYWLSKKETYSDDRLKRFRYIRLKGLIQTDQNYTVYVSYDSSPFVELGTIRGDSSYVDRTNSQAIGNNGLGTISLGGSSDISTAYEYYAQIRVRVPKFRTRQFKIVANGIGYVNINMMVDVDILTFEQKMPRKYRQKQHVSLDGTETDLPTFDS